MLPKSSSAPREGIDMDLGVKAHTVDDIATVLLYASIAFTLWGVSAPQQALFFTKRRTRPGAFLLGACLMLFSAAIGNYSESGEYGLVLLLGAVTVGLVIYLSRLGPPMPKLRPAASSSPAVLARSTPTRGVLVAAQAQILAIRASVPTDQRPVFDQIYDTCMSASSLFGDSHAAKDNIELAQNAVGEAHRVWTLRSGPLPEVETTLSLDAGEICVWKGRAHDETKSVWNPDDGTMFLTTKRLIFIGKRQSLEFAFGGVRWIVVESGTLRLTLLDGRKMTFHVDDLSDPFDKRLASPFEILWNRLRKQQGPDASHPALPS
jgi:hypothetical protein